MDFNQASKMHIQYTKVYYFKFNAHTKYNKTAILKTIIREIHVNGQSAKILAFYPLYGSLRGCGITQHEVVYFLLFVLSIDKLSQLFFR